MWRQNGGAKNTGSRKTYALLELATSDFHHNSSGSALASFKSAVSRWSYRILENFEHLLETAPQPTDLLHEAAALKIVVTSREALNLREEWQHQVDGLSYPDANTGEAPERFSAGQLFVRHARRVRPGFSLADEQAGVVQICRLVEGTPLALELAASWAKSMTCSEIAVEIQQNLDFLATRLHDVPDRHQSMPAVFNHSWALLGPQEQAVFKRLAVFCGPFRRQAAGDRAVWVGPERRRFGQCLGCALAVSAGASNCGKNAIYAVAPFDFGRHC